ncbi:hypothetical protein BB560_005929 [Smittium megazygosporum]|uniref:Branched-chain-amino-acid aminotransferase n=1 Tax=Smittium megazygosporum TaxID=133381 RepID=A0A2T9YQF1_9FUNG|nr:hypothetical protein BB560_005929 [Smittium megazygosporum]
MFLLSNTLSRGSFASRRAITLALKATYSSAPKPTFYHKDLQITEVSSRKTYPPKEKLVFGHTFTDHMLEAKWTRENGWETPRIVPYHDLQISPASSSLHYALQCFEGAKAFIGTDGKPRVFRLDKNMERMNRSVTAIGLEGFDGKEAEKCIEELIRLEKNAIPSGMGYSLYLRPTVISTEPTLGVRASNSALFYVICCPCGPYFPTGFKAVKLYADTDHVRAWPGGTGGFKLGSNYAPGMYPQFLANQKGYQQILWLFGKDNHVSEAGTMNAFVFWVNEQGVLELLTPELDGTILPGVTRDSILSIARKWGEFQVTEGKITMDQIVNAVREGRLREMFGAGTACVISPIKAVGYMGSEIQVPLDPNDPNVESGPLAKRLYNEIMGIQYGEIPHEWSRIL